MAAAEARGRGRSKGGAARAEAEAEALRELERELWVPPRVRAVGGLSEDLSALPWDFAPTPGAALGRQCGLSLLPFPSSPSHSPSLSL